MAGDSNIEWTDRTWNPIVGCSIISPGCTNCYAMKMAARIEAMAKTNFDRLNEVGPIEGHYCGLTKKVNGNVVWTGKVALAPHRILQAPYSWRKPKRIFVNSMGDLFHESIPDDWIDRVFAVMALCPQHTFQVLTKRAERMREYCSALSSRAVEIAQRAVWLGIWDDPDAAAVDTVNAIDGGILPNVWLGVSCERQQEWDERTEYLRETPAAIRFVSIEPMLGPINCGALSASKLIDDPGIDWIICGGESGSKARGTPRANFLSVRDQCAATGVAYFHKQNGEWIDADEWLDTIECGPSRLVTGGVQWKPQRPLNYEDAATLARFTGNRCYEHQSDGTTLIRVGKKSAGRLLDGREHNAFPVIDSSASQGGLSPHENKTAEAATL